MVNLAIVSCGSALPYCNIKHRVVYATTHIVALGRWGDVASVGENSIGPLILTTERPPPPPLIALKAAIRSASKYETISMLIPRWCTSRALSSSKYGPCKRGRLREALSNLGLMEFIVS
ncbi:hypothetical protein EVAR_14657_1 [Eumeta japonica]|uniref:Uncharacterized protein n=1 Tax=Eumeta variegata TaxID=151549 RepID=A0A4C1U2C7_EUMVA|nr:hypothetical protein EVAR_14657_1 [Eumeta japonica]